MRCKSPITYCCAYNRLVLPWLVLRNRLILHHQALLHGHLVCTYVHTYVFYIHKYLFITASKYRGVYLPTYIQRASSSTESAHPQLLEYVSLISRQHRAAPGFPSSYDQPCQHHKLSRNSDWVRPRTTVNLQAMLHDSSPVSEFSTTKKALGGHD